MVYKNTKSYPNRQLLFFSLNFFDIFTNTNIQKFKNSNFYKKIRKKADFGILFL
jgi:hypothetical protein